MEPFPARDSGAVEYLRLQKKQHGSWLAVDLYLHTIVADLLYNSS